LPLTVPPSATGRNTFRCSPATYWIGLASPALAALEAYLWPVNIRELRNLLERATLLHDGADLSREGLRFGTVRSRGEPSEPPGADLTLKAVERHHIERILRLEHGKVEPATRRLGVPRSSLYQKIRQFQIVVPKD
jgi:DNA-binding NtrC family response regulator